MTTVLEPAGFLPLFPLVVANSAFVPVRSTLGWLQALANVQQVSVRVNAVRALVSGGPVDHWLRQATAQAAGILGPMRSVKTTRA
jgi:hypothetical protein